MSYDITNWKTKNIEDLKVSLDTVERLPYTETTIGTDHKLENSPLLFSANGMSEGFQLNGVLNDGVITVSEIKNYGEGSGSTWKEFIEMLTNSEGHLDAVMIWEGGDSISRLIVIDGEVIDKPVEL